MTSRTRFLLLAVLAGWATTTQAQVPAAKAAPGAPPASSATPVPSADPVGTAPGEAWGSAHWNMTPEEVLSAFPKAFRLEPEVRLEDGNTVTVGIDGHSFEGLAFRVRFIFAKGKLALVSLRTDPAKYVDAPAYEKLRKDLVARWGNPVESAADSNFIDMRQTRWDRGANRADLKYIPGVVAMVFYPRPAPQ